MIRLYFPTNINLLVPAPPGMGRQRPQNTQEDRDSMGTAVDTIRNISHTLPYTLPLPGIYLLQGCVSGTWWYATVKLG